jgi:hypothetical protein
MRGSVLGEPDGAVVVAVGAVAEMQMPANDIVDVIAMGDGLMAATGTVTVTGIMTAAGVSRCTSSRIR